MIGANLSLFVQFADVTIWRCEQGCSPGETPTRAELEVMTWKYEMKRRFRGERDAMTLLDAIEESHGTVASTTSLKKEVCGINERLNLLRSTL